MKCLIKMFAFLAFALLMGCRHELDLSNGFRESFDAPGYHTRTINRNSAAIEARCEARRLAQNGRQGYNPLADDEASCYTRGEYGQPLHSIVPDDLRSSGGIGGFGYGGLAPGGFIRPTQAMPTMQPGFVPGGYGQPAPYGAPQAPVVQNGAYVPMAQYRQDQDAITQRIETTRR